MPKLPDVTAFGQRAINVDPILKTGWSGTTRTGALPGAGINEIGTGLQQLSKDIETENQRYDTVVAENAFNKLREKQLELTSGDDGYTQRRGEDAATKPVMEEYTKKYEEQVNRITDGLGNDRQKALLRKRAEISGLELKSGILSHVTREREMFEKTTLDKTTQVEMDNVVANFQDRSAVKMAMARLTNSYVDYFDKRGHRSVQNEDGTFTHSPVVEDALRNVYSKMNRAVIERHLVNDNDITAEEIYNKGGNGLPPVKGTMTAEDTIAVERALEVGSTRGKSLRTATALMDKHNGNFGLAAKEARSMYAGNAKMLDATLKNIQSISAENEAIQKLDSDQRVTTAHDYVKAGKQMPATTEAALSPEARTFFNDPNNAAIIQGKAPRTHDQAAYNEFMRLDRHDIAKMKEEDFLTKYYYKVNDDSARRVAQIRDWSIEAAKKDPKAETLLRNDVNLRQLVLGKVIEAGLIDARKKTADYTQDDETMLNEAVARASDELEKMQVKNGRKATVEEERAVVNGIVLQHAKVKVPGKFLGIFAGEKKASELTAEERSKAYYTFNQVPVVKRDQLRRWAAELGVGNPSDDTIAKAYTAYMQTEGLKIASEDRRARIAAILGGK